MLEWIAISSPGDLPDPGIEPGSPTLQADVLPSEPPGKPSSDKESVMMRRKHNGKRVHSTGRLNICNCVHA